MSKTKTEVERCGSCGGTGWLGPSHKYDDDPDYGCGTCGGDGYRHLRGKAGSGKVKVTYEWTDGYWREISSKPAKGWF